MTNAWLWWEKSKTCKSRLNFSVRGQSVRSVVSFFLVRLMNTTYFICILKTWTWACGHSKSSNLSADNFKKHSNPVGRYLSPRYGQAILVSGYTVLATVNRSKHGCTIRLQAPKLAWKCEVKHRYDCGADGRKVGRSVYRHLLATFSRMDIFFKQWGFS